MSYTQPMKKYDAHQKLGLGHAECLVCSKGERSLILDCVQNYLRSELELKM